MHAINRAVLRSARCIKNTNLKLLSTTPVIYKSTFEWPKPLKKIVDICKPANLNAYEFPPKNEFEDNLENCQVLLAYRPAHARKDLVHSVMGDKITALMRNHKRLAHWRVVLMFESVNYACELYTQRLKGGAIESKIFEIGQVSH